MKYSKRSMKYSKRSMKYSKRSMKYSKRSMKRRGGHLILKRITLMFGLTT